MLTRPRQTLTWDAENRLASVTQGGTTTAFTYDGDGNRVRVAVGNVVTVYVGSLYEVNATSGVTTTYYYFGSQRVAMRTAAGATYLAGDHLGSASLAMGASNTSQRYYPYGGTRSGGVPTDYQFTGQKLDTGTSLYYYGARYYDPVTGRFVSADTVVPSPGKPQALNRYSYVYDNPVKYTDPTGHRVCGDPDTESCESSGTRFETFRNTPPDDIPSSPAGGDPATPWQVGLEWLTGRGQREHQFRAGDPFTALLRKHEHVEDVRNEVRRIISRRLDHSQPWRLDYSLGGLEGVPKYFRDYSTLLTGGLTGNLAVTYLGSYELELFVLNVDRNNGTITTLFNVHNESNLASATHPPVLGYTWLWEQTIGSWANGLRTSGPLSPTRQEFWWSETFGWK
jgi:RHS repeat-associated protein